MRHLILKPSNSYVRPFLFDNFFENFFDNNYENDFSPKVDIIENDKSFDISFAVPGMEKKDLNIEINKGYLTVSGERKIDSSDNNYYKIETGYGKFSRSFQLPDEINEEKISAVCKNGILKVSVLKDEKTTVKKTIQIK